MLDMDECFSKGVVCSSDVEEWLAGREPEQAHKAVCDLWDVHIKPPEMALGERTEYSFANSLQKVTINFEMASIWSRMFGQKGGEQPFSSLLKADLGEQMTYYLSFNVNPEHHEREHDLLLKWQETYSINDFIEYASMSSKLQAIGFIGRNRVAADIPDYADISCNISNLIARTNDRHLRGMLARISAGMMDAEYLREITPTLLRNTLAGTGEEVLAGRLERQYDGRLRELIRENGNAPFRSEYVGYVRENTPAYGTVLNAAFETDIF